MAWPTSQDYNEAIQNPATSFSDPDLKKGEVALNAIGLPVPRSGNFADVYEFKTADGKKWALKLFTRQVAGLQERYAKIDEHLSKAKFPFTVGFKYFAQGIRIRGEWYPLLKMEWVEGFTLNEFVRDNAGKPQYLHALMQMWGKLTALLRDAEFAHADLQHGNVLLVPATTGGKLGLRLIDYDGMWVPALAETHSGEVGHPNFQHPLRLKDRLYNADVDRFPHLVIAAALRGTLIGGKPFWDKFDNGDNLLFKETDLRDPANSPVFKALWNLNDSVLCTIVGKMAIASKEPLRKTPWLDDLLLTDDGKRLSDDEEAKVVQLLGVAPHFTAAATAAAPAVQDEFNAFAFEDEEPTVKKDRSAGHKALAAKDDKKPRKGAKKEEKKSKLALYIGGGVAALLALIGIIIAASGGGGKKDTPSQRDVVKEEPKREPPKIVLPPEKKKDNEEPKVIVKKDEPKDVVPPKKDDPKEVVVVGQPALLKAPFTKAQAEKARAEWAKFLNIPERKELDLGKGVKLELVLIPPGEFMMGDKATERSVTITRPYYVSKTETTQEQFETVMGTNPSKFSAAKDNTLTGQDTGRYPVDRITFSDATDFCTKAKVQLPTEAQWEYACRGGTTTMYHVGEELTPTDANFSKALNRTSKAGSFSTNVFGLHEMHGNVWEWCSDFFDKRVDDLPSIDPHRTVQLTTENRTIRGGGYNSNPKDCRAAERRQQALEGRSEAVGFRIILPAPDNPTAVAKLPDPDPKEVGKKDPTVGAPALLKAPFTKEQAEKARAEWAKFLNVPERKELDLGKGVKLELALIPAGEFMMGPNDKQRQVIISRPFYLAATETTQVQYETVMGNNPSLYQPKGAKGPSVKDIQTAEFPVENIVWQEADDFSKKIKATLPTEAQWEYACRAGSTTLYHFGDQSDQKLVNIGKQIGRPTQVSSYPANAFGLFDMHGNVNEWCRDFDDASFDDLPLRDPERIVPRSSTTRVQRGGAFSAPAMAGSSARFGVEPNQRSGTRGFRVMMPAPDNPTAVAKLPDPDPKEIGKKDPIAKADPTPDRGIGELKRLWQDKRSVSNANGSPISFTSDGTGILLRLTGTQALQRLRTIDGVKEAEIECGTFENCKGCSNDVVLLHLVVDGKRVNCAYDLKTGVKLYELPATASIRDGWPMEDSNLYTIRTSDRTLTTFQLKDGTIRGVAYSTTSSIVACSQSLDKKTSALFTAQGDMHIQRAGHPAYKVIRLAEVASVASSPECFSINERYAALAYKDNTIRIFDSTTGKELKTLEGHTQPPQVVQFTTNPRYLISVSDDESLRIWDVETGKLVQNHEMKGRCKGAVISPDGQYLFTPTNYPESLQVWRFDDSVQPEPKVVKKEPPATTPVGEIKSVWTVKHQSAHGSLVFTEDNSSVTLRDARTGSIVTHAVDGGKRTHNAKIPSPDAISWILNLPGGLILTRDNKSTAIGWDVAKEAEVFRLQGIPELGSLYAWVDKSNPTVMIPHRRGELDIYSVKDGSKTGVVALPPKANEGTVSITPDGRFIAVMGPGNEVALRGPDQKWRNIGQLEAGKGKLRLAISPDAKHIAFNQAAGPVHLIDTATGKKKLVLSGHEGEVFRFSFTTSGRQLLTVSLDRTMRLWDVQTGKELQKVTLTGEGRGLAISSDGLYAVTTTSDETVQLWSLQSGAPVAKLPEPEPMVVKKGPEPKGVTPAREAKEVLAMLTRLKMVGQAELMIEDERFLEVKTAVNGKKNKIFSEPVPAWLEDRQFHLKAGTPDKNGHLLGYTQFTVDKDGIVMTAVNPGFKGGGNAGGGWIPECMSRDQFLAAGWREAGMVKINDTDWPLYWRECKKGESIRLRTHKYSAPIIIK